MTAVVAQRDVERLGKLLGMLGSEHEGERSAAAAAADRKLRELGLTWEQLVARAFHVASPPGQPRPAAARHLAATDWLMACWPFLSEWERNFTSSLRAQASLTLRQRAKLGEIVRRVEMRCGGTCPA